MKYIGLQSQITRNNRMSVVLLISFPLLIFAGVFILSSLFAFDDYTGEYQSQSAVDVFLQVMPIVAIVVAIWFAIAYAFNSKMINYAAGSKTLERKDNMRIYNLTENLCMSVGMPMPMLRIVESPALNAFASGINEKSYCVTLTRGIIEHLDDDELEGVIAHELMHIRNKDVKLLIISIIFVGIFSFAAQYSYRIFWHSSAGRRRSSNSKDNGAILILAVMVVSIVAYFLSVFFKLALSRKREYMADAGAAEMTRKPWALANALRKISGNSHIENITNQDIKELFIDNTPPKDKSNMNFMSSIGQLFSTHPPIEKRIAFLENL